MGMTHVFWNVVGWGVSGGLCFDISGATSQQCCHLYFQRVSTFDHPLLHLLVSLSLVPISSGGTQSPSDTVVPLEHPPPPRGIDPLSVENPCEAVWWVCRSSSSPDRRAPSKARPPPPPTSLWSTLWGPTSASLPWRKVAFPIQSPPLASWRWSVSSAQSP